MKAVAKLTNETESMYFFPNENGIVKEGFVSKDLDGSNKIPITDWMKVTDDISIDLINRK